MRYIVCFSFFFFVSAVHAHGQLTDSLRRELQKKSKSFQTAGKLDFIFAEALLDGLVHLGEECRVEINKGLIRINGKELPPRLRQKYEGMLYSLCESAPERIKNSSYSFSQMKAGGVFSTKPESSMLGVCAPIEVPGAKVWRPVVERLAANNVLDTCKSYRLDYRSDGLWVNGRKLQGRVAATCIRLLKDNGNKLNSPNDRLSYSQDKEGGCK
ncbi:MAG: hypothetical protein KF744_11355 [Taibaiella sp.]|nr:hypothetical protein [Taibaiella sp.]